MEILRILFPLEEARVALKLTMQKQTLAELRDSFPELGDSLEAILKRMAGQGTVFKVLLPASSLIPADCNEPLEIKNYGKVVLAAGCYGIGAILRIAAALKQIGNHVTVITEGRSHYKHYYKEKLTAACDEMGEISGKTFAGRCVPPRPARLP